MKEEVCVLENYDYKKSKRTGVPILIITTIFMILLMIFIIVNRRTYWWIGIYIFVSFFIIELIVYVSTNLNYYDMMHPNLVHGTIIDTENLRKYRKIPNTDEYKNKVQLGYDIARTKKIVILCLARDVEANVIMTRNKLESIGKDFLEYKIVIFENDSEDESRNLLKGWMNENENVDLMDCCDIGSCECRLKNAKGYDLGAISKGRMDNMRYYRETLLRYTTNKYYDYDYVMVYDFDISGSVYKDGLMTSFSSDKDWDMVFANGLQSLPMITFKKLALYDRLAYIPEDLDFQHGLSPAQLGRKLFNNIGKYNVGDDLVKCKSGFNGMAIYTMKCLRDSSYMNTERYCEHVDLHSDMYNNGYDEIYYNPSMVLFVGQCGPDAIKVFSKK